MFPTVEEFRGIVENGDITQEEILKIQEMQYNFMNYSEEDQTRIQEIISEALDSATGPAREELRVLSGAITEQARHDAAATRTPEVRVTAGEDIDEDFGRRIVEDIFIKTADGRITPEGDREVYFFQYYFNESDVAANI